MKIAFAYESAYPWFNGGIEKRRYNILKALSKSKKYELHMFTLYRPGMPGREFEYEGVKYHCVGVGTEISGMYKGSRRSMLMSIKFALLLFLHIWKYKFDIIDTDSFPFLHIPLLYIYAKLRRTYLVATWHEVWSKEFWKGYLHRLGSVGFFFEYLSAKLPSMHIANTSTTKKLLRQYFSVEPKKVLVLPAAVDQEEVEKFLAKHACKQENKFVVANRLVFHKRTDIAVKSIKGVDAKLVIIGKGPELSNLKELAKQLGVDKQVVFKHDLTEQQLYEELCTSLALIMVSEREGLSLITAEALSLGVPVAVSSNTSLPPEILKYCLRSKTEDVHDLLLKIRKNAAAYKQNYLKQRKEVLAEFSGTASEAVYNAISRAREAK
jgi:glycosyltransferase involved in cell wall biosynthesis